MKTISREALLEDLDKSELTESTCMESIIEYIKKFPTQDCYTLEEVASMIKKEWDREWDKLPDKLPTHRLEELEDETLLSAIDAVFDGLLTE